MRFWVLGSERIEISRVISRDLRELIYLIPGLLQIADIFA